ncbi:MAG: glycosyl hydrolase-related protein [Gemmatimonadaceae bacterium]
MLLPNGADHHARQPDIGAALDSLRHAAGSDRVVSSSLGIFTEELSTATQAVDLPRIEGELRDSYGHCWTLQGTFASRASQKRRNAQVERLLLREAEPWSALASRFSPSRRALLHAAWRSLLLCHPHDTLCGCSSDDVARAMDARLDDAGSQAQGIIEDALFDLAAHDRDAARLAPDLWRAIVLVRNPAARPRRGVAEVELLRLARHVPVGPGSATGASGAPLPDPPPVRFFHQPLDDRIRHDRADSPRHYPIVDLVHEQRALVWVDHVGGYGTLAFPLDVAVPGGQPPGTDVVRPLASSDGIGNGLLDLRIADTGVLVLREIASGRRITPVLRVEDVGDAGDLYTHSPVLPVVESTRPARSRVSATGPLRGVVQSSWSLVVPDTSSRVARAPSAAPLALEVTFELDAGAAFVRLRVTGDNLARDHRLRLVVGTGVQRPSVHADAAFSSLLREPIVATLGDASVELPPRTAPLHRHVTVSDDSQGVTVISDGLAEYEVLGSGDIAITLLRAVGELSRPDLPERPGHAGWPVVTPEAQSQGRFEAVLAIYPHGPRDTETIAAIERAADDVLLPLVGRTLRSALSVPSPTEGIALEGDTLAFSTLKESEDGEWLVLRCVNLADQAATGVWRLGFDAREARSARLDETPGASLALAGRSVPIAVPPRGISTVLVR